MTKTNWRWVVAGGLALQGLMLVLHVFSPQRGRFDYWVLALYAVLLLGTLAYYWRRSGTAGIREYLDRRAAPAPAFSERRGQYLFMLALWIVVGVGFSYYIAFGSH
jgi:hypothetical protein